MKSFPKTLHPIAAAVMSLTLAMPAAAVPQGATLSFTPGSGNKPVVRTERGDFQAGQRFSTGANEVRELIFPDGLSVTLAPNSELVIESLPSAGSGAVLRVNRGLVRVAGGAGNDTQPVIVQTPAERIRLNAASAVIQVGEGGRTRANLLVGRGLAMSRAAADQGVQRPGFALEVADSQSTPLGPSRLGEEVFASDTLLLSTSQLTGGTEDGSSPLLVAAINTSQMTGSRFAEASENQPASQPAGQQSSGSGGVLPPVGGTPPLPPPTGVITPPPLPPPPIAGFVDLSVVSQGGVAGGGFDVGSGVPGPVVPQVQPSESNGDTRNLAQTRGNATGKAITSDFLEPSRQAGPTVSRLFNSSDQYSQVLGANRPITLRDRPDSQNGPGESELGQIDLRLQYVFRNERTIFDVIGLQLDAVGRNLSSAHYYNGGSFDSNAPLIINSLPNGWPEPGQLGPVFTLINGQNGNGHMFKDVALVSILQGGFKPNDNKPNESAERKNDNVMVRKADNFLMLQLAPVRVDSSVSSGNVLSGEAAPTGSERFVFAAGNVDAGRINADGSVNATFANQLSVDRFFLSAGLENFADKDVAGSTVASNIRAFLRRDSSVETAVADGGLFVVNTGSSAPGSQNGLLHADFGMDGSGGGQRSTISATIGNLSYRLSTQPDLDIKNSYAVDVDARTVGSSRSGTTGLVAITSPLTSTAAGGGNPSLARDGYAGYLVLENYVPEDTTNFGGGVEHALGTAPSADQRYALLRLATATGSLDLSSITRTTRELTGWAGGLAEREIPGSSTLDVVPMGTGTDPGNLSIRTNADTNRVQASLALNGGAVLSLGGLGASASPSAFVDDKRFGAANAQTALISADVLRNALGNLPPALSSIPNYSHLQWGFFFGDVSAASGPRDHLHMGTWVSGLAASQLPTTGEATYIGHAIGNVTAGGAPYTAVGSYKNSWNFAQRSGSVILGFDSAQYSGTTRLQANNVVFDGALTGVPNRSGGVVGNFMRSSAGDGGGAPAAMGGRFVISETQGTTYRASGTFGAERKP